MAFGGGVPLDFPSGLQYCQATSGRPKITSEGNFLDTKRSNDEDGPRVRVKLHWLSTVEVFTHMLKAINIVKLKEL